MTWGILDIVNNVWLGDDENGPKLYSEEEFGEQAYPLALKECQTINLILCNGEHRCEPREFILSSLLSVLNDTDLQESYEKEAEQNALLRLLLERNDRTLN